MNRNLPVMWLALVTLVTVIAIMLGNSSPRAANRASQTVAAAEVTEIVQAVGAIGPRPLVRMPDDGAATAATLEAARGLVAKLTNNGIAALNDPAMDIAERRAYFRNKFEQSFATSDIGRIVLGTYWPRASKQERMDFLDALGGYIADTLIRRFPANGEFEVLNARQIDPTPSGARRIEVRSRFSSIDLEGEVIWIVMEANEALKILDAAFAGRSFLLAQRDEFAEIMRQNGGSITALIAELQAL